MKISLDDWREIMCALERIIAANVIVRSFAVNQHTIRLRWEDGIPYVIHVESTDGHVSNWDD